MERLTNKRNGRVIAERVVVAATPFARLRGLLGRSSFDPGEALILPSCSAVHMFFMRFPIDVVFCDQAFRVVDIQANLQPWRISRFVTSASTVIELPSSVSEETGLKVGDTLEVL